MNIRRDPSQYAFNSKQSLSLSNRRWEIITGTPKKFVTNPYWTTFSLIILISGFLASLATFSFLLYQHYRLLQRQP